MIEQAETSQSHRLVLKKYFFIVVPVFFVFLWSSGAIFVELGLQYTKPFTFLSLRLLFAAIIMWLVCLCLRSPFPETLAAWRNILITGIFLQAGYQTFFFLALAHNLSPGLLAIILGAQPIITSTLTKEGTSRMQWFGLLLGILGLILVVAPSLLLSFTSVFGIMSALLSLTSITVGTILQKQTKVSLPLNMAIQYTGSAIILLFLAVTFEAYAVTWSVTFEVSLAWMVLVVSTGATMLLYYMIRQGNLTNVTSLFYCVPPVTSVLDYLVFGHILPAVAILGMVFIIGGLILINRQGRLV